MRWLSTRPVPQDAVGNKFDAFMIVASIEKGIRHGTKPSQDTDQVDRRARSGPSLWPWKPERFGSVGYVRQTHQARQQIRIDRRGRAKLFHRWRNAAGERGRRGRATHQRVG